MFQRSLQHPSPGFRLPPLSECTRVCLDHEDGADISSTASVISYETIRRNVLKELNFKKKQKNQ